ncbi:MAG TPA: DUF4185 domain-containing protein [Lacipirellulaceae bacterium]|jgi:hypothetical protein
MTNGRLEILVGDGRCVYGAFAVALSLLAGNIAKAEDAASADFDVRVTAEAWPEADAMFHRDPRWLGGDDAYSIDLGGGRVVWFFGDSFVAPTVPGDRKGTTMVRNSVGLQTGYDPVNAEFKCYWRAEDGKPSSFIANDLPDYYWPGGGLLHDGKLLVLFMRARDAEGKLSFITTGWGAVLIDNLQETPDHWRVKKLTVPQNDFDVLVGSGSVLVDGDFVKAFSARSSRDHEIFLVRWPLTDAMAGDLARPQWWAGEERGWIDQANLDELPTPVMTPGSTEFVVYFSQEMGVYVQMQFTGFPQSSIGARFAHALTGPWSTLKPFYAPEEMQAQDPGILLYAAKPHPEQAADGQAMTYCSNTFKLARVLEENNIYFPRFIRNKFETPTR